MKELPWNTLDGKIYSAKELKPRKQWVQIGGWILAIALIACGILTKYKVTLIFGVLYLITMATHREQVVTDRGVEIFHDMKITTNYDLWKWEDLNSIIIEDAKHESLVRLHFGKGDKEKALFFDRAESKEIVKLAEKKNPGIRVIKANSSGRKMGKR